MTCQPSEFSAFNSKADLFSSTSDVPLVSVVSKDVSVSEISVVSSVSEIFSVVSDTSVVSVVSIVSASD